MSERVFFYLALGALAAMLLVVVSGLIRIQQSSRNTELMRRCHASHEAIRTPR